jgi:hypothetical protein
MASNCRVMVNNELERMWEEPIMSFALPKFRTAKCPICIPVDTQDAFQMHIMPNDTVTDLLRAIIMDSQQPSVAK